MVRDWLTDEEWENLTPYEIEVWEELKTFIGKYLPPTTWEEITREFSLGVLYGDIASCELNKDKPRVAARVLLGIFM